MHSDLQQEQCDLNLLFAEPFSLLVASSVVVRQELVSRDRLHMNFGALKDLVDSQIFSRIGGCMRMTSPGERASTRGPTIGAWTIRCTVLSGGRNISEISQGSTQYSYT